MVGEKDKSYSMVRQVKTFGKLLFQMTTDSLPFDMAPCIGLKAA